MTLDTYAETYEDAESFFTAEGGVPYRSFPPHSVQIEGNTWPDCWLLYDESWRVCLKHWLVQHLPSRIAYVIRAEAGGWVALCEWLPAYNHLWPTVMTLRIEAEQKFAAVYEHACMPIPD